MIKLNQEAAIKQSIELAKALCETQGQSITIDKDGANELADFIETLQNRFVGQSQ